MPPRLGPSPSVRRLCGDRRARPGGGSHFYGIVAGRWACDRRRGDRRVAHAGRLGRFRAGCFVFASVWGGPPGPFRLRDVGVRTDGEIFIRTFIAGRCVDGNSHLCDPGSLAGRLAWSPRPSHWWMLRSSTTPTAGCGNILAGVLIGVWAEARVLGRQRGGASRLTLRP